MNVLTRYKISPSGRWPSHTQNTLSIATSPEHMQPQKNNILTNQLSIYTCTEVGQVTQHNMYGTLGTTAHFMQNIHDIFWHILWWVKIGPDKMKSQLGGGSGIIHRCVRLCYFVCKESHGDFHLWENMESNLEFYGAKWCQVSLAMKGIPWIST